MIMIINIIKIKWFPFSFHDVLTEPTYRLVFVLFHRCLCVQLLTPVLPNFIMNKFSYPIDVVDAGTAGTGLAIALMDTGVRKFTDP